MVDQGAIQGRFLKIGPRTWLACLLGFSLFYFYSGGGANQASRFNLDRALLEHGRLTIDEYHRSGGAATHPGLAFGLSRSADSVSS